jgi:hypothetical protein
MNEFLQIVNTKLNQFKKFQFSKTIEYSIRDQVLNHLKLDNINQLRDKFEGVAFLEKTLQRSLSLHVISSILGVELINLHKIDIPKLNNKVLFKERKIQIVLFNFGELPIIQLDKELTYFFLLKRDNFCYYYCGNIEGLEIHNNMDNMINQTNKFIFRDFDKLNL